MGFEVPGFKSGHRVTDADLSAKQYYAMKIKAGGLVEPAGAGEEIYGILQNKPLANQHAEIVCNGISKGVAGAAITEGAKVTPDANGKLVTATTGDFAIGYAEQAATADGDVIAFYLTNLDIQP